MAHVVGKLTVEVRVKFCFDEILKFVNASSLTPVQFEAIAHVLVANLEEPHKHDGELTHIDRDSFNDSFFDMQEDLIEKYGDK